MSSSSQALVDSGQPVGLSKARLGSWNISHWTSPKAHIIAKEICVDILAIQESHLASFPLECAHGTCRNLGLHLHHGHPVPPIAQRVYGRSCGVGFVARQGVALVPVPPIGPAWRRLHAMSRLHATRLPPRPGLPHGILLLTVYAPLQIRAQAVVREQFVSLMLEVSHSLDLQVPTFLMGDFNGSVDPSRDFLSESGRKRPVCPLLASLLGPGGAWVDVHRALLVDVPWTFQSVDTANHLSASRIDLVLANHAALRLVMAASVLESVGDGGHSPVMFDVRLDGPPSLNWIRPRPRLPALLTLGSAELNKSVAWEELLVRWMSSPPLVALSPSPVESMSTLSSSMIAALHHLVDLAGGWNCRPPHRRPAYDSNELRTARRNMASLLHLASLLRSSPVDHMGCWPRKWEQLLNRLGRAGVSLPHSTIPTLSAAVHAALTAHRSLVSQVTKRMRDARHKRWMQTLPTLWHERPGVVYNWLHAVGAPWGTTPILNDLGEQCLSPAAVDRAVRGFWVDQILRCHAGVNDSACWATFLSSRFGSHIPRLDWPAPPWSADRVRSVLGSMREGASPGSLGIPIGVWKALPELWHGAVARLLTLVELEGRWPAEWCNAFVAMIPKSAGGSRPQDQRPITVLDLVYRIWSKGVVLAWAPVLQQSFLGQAAMGFRAGAGTLHVAQLLSDLMILQRRRRQQLWLASFDVQKCFDSLPWWAVFGVLRQAGVAPRVVGCFEAFYASLTRKFRYGQIDGVPWQATNGLAQGCPASPDLLNILLEPFHRWALAEGYGVEVCPGCRVPSVSFADDVALVAGGKPELEILIAAYLDWCSLLGVRVTKVQAWSNVKGTHSLQVPGLEVVTSSTFRMVGVALGLNERLVTETHFKPRLEKAMATTLRLRMLELPSSLSSLLWRTAVLPQALYGCEVRNITPAQLTPLSRAGQAAVAVKPPLQLNCWRAPEVLMGPPLGHSSVLDPVMDVRQRQLRWAQLVANLPSIVGVVHRQVAWDGLTWKEPTASLATALQSVGWQLHRNLSCNRTLSWPFLSPEPNYPGTVTLQPIDSFPPLDATYTDGSVMSSGGAAAVQPDTGTSHLAAIPQPRSSTHCELIALGMGLQMNPTPPVIITDSLVALQLLRGWSTLSPQRILNCSDRHEVRWVLSLAAAQSPAPSLEKIKAHDQRALDLGHPKAIGNNLADQAARSAATLPSCPQFHIDLSPFHDPVELLDASGAPVLGVKDALQMLWWERRQQSCSSRRPWMNQLYPTAVPLDWPLSTIAFHRPVVSGGSFVHPCPVPVVKWLARARSGCLASRLRLFNHHLGPTATCPCCDSNEEDEAHMVSGCPGTGSADWMRALLEVWASSAHSLSISVPPPPTAWLEQFRFPLLVALIPTALIALVPLPLATCRRFLARVHLGLAAQLAEWMRRRADIIATTMVIPALEPADPPPSMLRPCPLPLERQLLPTDLRRLEVQRRSLPAPPSSALIVVTAEPHAPPSGEPRRRWLRTRLERLLREDTIVCPPAMAAVAVDLLCLFETITKEQYADTPGTKLTSRVAGFGKVMGNISREVAFVPPLIMYNKSGRASWNRRPRVSLNVTAWRTQVQRQEQLAPSVSRLRTQRLDCNAGLVDWVKKHRHLSPAAVDDGETSMALLLLWEVDHGRPFPCSGAQNRSAILLGFTRRLKAKVTADKELGQWLFCKEVQRSLAPGLPAVHQFRWSVRIVPPPALESRGWYDTFVEHWRHYLESLASPATTPAAPAQAAIVAPNSACPPIVSTAPLKSKQRPADTPSSASLPKKRRMLAPDVAISSVPLVHVDPCPLMEPPSPRRRPSEFFESEDQPPRKRACDIRSWLTPRLSQPHCTPSTTDVASSSTSTLGHGGIPIRHGRATQGPPT